MSEYGDKYYYKDGTTSGEYDDSKDLHRIDGPAIEYINGTKSWYMDGKLHRVGGPAIERSTGTKSWYMDGNLHRIDGPAMDRADGAKHWCIDGKSYLEEEFDQLIKEIKDLPPAVRLTDPREWVRKVS